MTFKHQEQTCYGVTLPASIYHNKNWFLLAASLTSVKCMHLPELIGFRTYEIPPASGLFPPLEGSHSHPQRLLQSTSSAVGSGVMAYDYEGNTAFELASMQLDEKDNLYPAAIPNMFWEVSIDRQDY